MSRRDALGLAGLAAAPAPAKTIPIGMATTEFRKHSNKQLAAEFREQGIKRIQLFLTQTDSRYWRYNQPSDLAGMTAERAAEIAGLYHSAGISIHSVGVYANLIHPDPAEKKANFAYFEAMMKLGGHMGVRTFITEIGHYRAPGETGIPFDWREDVWKAAVATAKELAQIAAAHGATVLLEAYFQGLLATAKRTRMFIEEVGSPRIRALLDPANLLEVNDVREMFDQLGPYIACMHAKDRKYHVTRGVGAGEGDLDYPAFVTLAAARTPGVPLMLEYVGAGTYKQALAHLRRVIREAGLQEA
ncbi:MAG: sugar phosphate isomerase/epimerase family protein [Bryobacteraceae bacterium]